MNWKLYEPEAELQAQRAGSRRICPSQTPAKLPNTEKNHQQQYGQQGMDTRLEKSRS
jgi:hypothetical protein